MNLFKLLLLLNLTFFLFSCADAFKEINGLEEIVGEESSQEEENPILSDDEENLLSGVFLDASVDGVSYTGNGATGTTDSKGTFYYQSGSNVTFTIGGITLGTATGQSTITPLEIVGTTDIGNQIVVNILRVLQTLDDDGNPDNGIQITEAVRKQAANQTINFNQSPDDFETNTTSLISSLTSVRSAGTITLVSSSQAIAHFSSTASGLGITTSSSPADITLSASTISENQMSGTTIGTLIAVDADDSTHTFSLVAGTGDTDNASFSISGSLLISAKVFDYETQSSLSILIRATDSTGNFIEEKFTITVNDVSESTTTTTTVVTTTTTVVTTTAVTTTTLQSITDLSQASYSSTTTDQELYTGLYKYDAPSKLIDASGNDRGTVGIRPQAGADDIIQLNVDSSVTKSYLSELATSLNSGSNTHTININFAKLTFTAVQNSKYQLSVKSSTSTWTTELSSTNESGGVVVGKSTSAAFTTTAGVFTANSTAMNIWLSGVAPNYSVTVNPLDSSDTAAAAYGQTVTLQDNVPPMIAIQSTNAPLTTIGGTNVGTSSGSLGYPVFELRPRYYAETARTSTNGTISLLGGSSRFYTASNYSTWSAARAAVVLAVTITEQLDTSTVSAAKVRANTTTTPNTDSTLQDETNGLSNLTVNNSSSGSSLQATLGDFRTIADLAFMNITGLTDSAGNAADTTTGLLFVDKTPALATSITIGGSSLTFTFDQAITGTFSGYTDGTTIVSIMEDNVSYGIGSTTHYHFVTDTDTTSTAPAGLLVKRVSDQTFQDLYGNTISTTSYVQVESVSLSTDSKTLTVTVSSSIVDPTNPSASNSNAKMDSFFSEISYSRAATVGTTENYITYDNLRDSHGEYWGHTIGTTASIGSSYDAFILDSSLQFETPAITPIDSAHPRIAATGLSNVVARGTGSATTGTYVISDNAIYDGSVSSSTAVVLAIAHTDVVSTAGILTINSTGTNAQHGYTLDGLWNVSDTTSAVVSEEYAIVIQFNESIVCNTCLATPTGSYGSACAVVYNNAGATSSTLIGSSSNTLRVDFNLSSGSSVASGDRVTIYGVEDTSGNTMPNFTLTLGDSTQGIIVTPTSAIY